MTESRLCQAMTHLSEIMKILRSPEGCPWDIAQTPESLKPFILEEAHEVLEAIDEGAPDFIRDELGDLLLQVVFQSRIFEERGDFDLSEVTEAIADKLVRRHPHVFGKTKRGSSVELNAQWERIKEEEHSERGQSAHSLDRLPRDLPALMRAVKVIDRFSSEQENPARLISALETKLLEMHQAVTADNKQQELILGELLFGLAALSRNQGIDPEDVLRRTANRRIREFRNGSVPKEQESDFPSTDKTGR